MAVLGKIRQRSIFLILVIGMALFAFVISGVLDGSSSNTGPTDPVGVINEEKIDTDYFRQMVEQTERTYNYSALQSVQLVWNQALRNTIFDQQFESLGIDAGKDQLEQIIASDENVISNTNFQNEAGFFDFGIFTNYLAQMKAENPIAYENWKNQEKSIIGVAKQRIYMDLIKASSGMTKVETQSMYHLENDNINIQFVQLPFDIIPDSLIKISDLEVKNYIKENKNKFKRDASRNIQYVAFRENPSDEDLSQIRLRLDGLKEQRISYNDVSKLTDTLEGFKRTDKILDFVDQYSEVSFDSVYKARGELNNEYADILFKLTPGEVFGPYKDGGEFKISRLIDLKENASLRASHILLTYKDATRANSSIIRSKKEARLEANRILKTVKRSSGKFEDLARQFSDGPTKKRGGDLGFFREGEMAQELFDFVNKNRVGRLGLIETEFGFHVVKITDKDDLALIADVVAAAVPSDKTSNEIFRNATQFEMDSNETGDFIGLVEKSNYGLIPVKQITVLEENLPGLPKQRAIVRWIFEEDSKVGDVKRFSISDGGYSVVQLTSKVKEGLANIDDVGSQVREILKKEKKAKLIKERFKNKVSLENLAELEDINIEIASVINQKNPSIVGAGNEPYIVGVAFAMKEGDTSQLIKGNNGVYKVLLLKKNIVEELDRDSYVNYARNITQRQSERLSESIFKALESAASIEDNRSLYY